MLHNQKIYRFRSKERKRQRHPHHNYSLPGYYFITICTWRMWHWFGNVCDGKMVLNENGKIVEQQLNFLTQRYNYIALDEWVIMPNHIHVIIKLLSVGSGRDLTLQPADMFSPQQRNKKSIPSLIGVLKTTSSKYIRQHANLFRWHRSYHDRIIRNEHELNRIRYYIRNNPKNWKK